MNFLVVSAFVVCMNCDAQVLVDVIRCNAVYIYICNMERERESEKKETVKERLGDRL